MVRMIITWSLHNRLIVSAGDCVPRRRRRPFGANLNVEAYPDPTPPWSRSSPRTPAPTPKKWNVWSASRSRSRFNGMPGLEDLRSTSIAGLTNVKCQFTYDTDYWKARQEVINRLNALSNLPQGVNPMLSPWSPTGEIVRYVLEGPGYTSNEIKAVQDWVLQRPSRRCPASSMSPDSAARSSNTRCWSIRWN